MALFDKRFTPCYPEDVEGLDATAQMLYVWLCKFADVDGGGAWPSRKTLAEKLGVSVDTVDDRMKALISAGVVSKETKVRENGSQTSNGYQIIRTKSADASRWLAAPPAADQRPPQPLAGGPHNYTSITNPGEQKAARERKKAKTWDTIAEIPLPSPIPDSVQEIIRALYGLGWRWPQPKTYDSFRSQLSAAMKKSRIMYEAPTETGWTLDLPRLSHEIAKFTAYFESKPCKDPFLSCLNWLSR